MGHKLQDWMQFGHSAGATESRAAFPMPSNSLTRLARRSPRGGTGIRYLLISVFLSLRRSRPEIVLIKSLPDGVRVAAAPSVAVA